MRTMWLLPLAALTLAGCGAKEEPKPVLPKEGEPPVTRNEPGKAPEKDPIQALTGKKVPPSPAGLKPAPRLTDRWQTSPTKAIDLAKKVEAKLAGLKGVSGQTLTHVELEGGRGQNASNVAVKQIGQFRVEYPVLIQRPEPSMTRMTLVSDGKRFSVEDGTVGWRSPEPVTGLASQAQLPVDRFVADFPRAIYTVFAGGRPLTNLIESAAKAGLDVGVEERLVPDSRTGALVGQYRLLVNRPKADVSKKGPFDIEVVIDKKLLLPVTIRTNAEHPGRQPLRVMWSMRWNLAPNQQFAPDAFQLPAAALSSKRSV